MLFIHSVVHLAQSARSPRESKWPHRVPTGCAKRNLQGCIRPHHPSTRPPDTTSDDTRSGERRPARTPPAAPRLQHRSALADQTSPRGPATRCTRPLNTRSHRRPDARTRHRTERPQRRGQRQSPDCRRQPPRMATHVIRTLPRSIRPAKSSHRVTSTAANKHKQIEHDHPGANV